MRDLVRSVLDDASGEHGSIASFLAPGSIASVLSVGSIASLGSVGSIASIGSVGSIASRNQVGAFFGVPVAEKVSAYLGRRIDEVIARRRGRPLS